MSGVQFSALRCRGGDERAAMRPFAPVKADHPSVGVECAVCADEIAPGDVLTVIPLGPGSDADDQAKAHRRGWYSALGLIAHAACAGLPLDDPEHQGGAS